MILGIILVVLFFVYLSGMDKQFERLDNYMKWFYKLERKFGRYAIHNLMYYMIILYAVGFVLEVFGNNFYSRFLALDMEMIFRGQIWRLVTFIMGPPNTSILFVLFSLYFYYLIGSVLENAWGAFRFNMYILFGVVLHILAALLIYLIFGVSFPFTTYYLNMSMFLAFATLMPDMEVLLLFLIPIKIKWLAYLDMVYFGLTIVGGYLYRFLPVNIWMGLLSIGIFATPVYATAALVSLLNFILFYALTRNYRAISPKEMKRKADYRHKIQAASRGSKHRCAVCGRTEEDGENLVFRYCSKCDGAYEYCSEHLYTHKHVIKNL